MVDPWIADVEEFLKIEADKIQFSPDQLRVPEVNESPKRRYDKKAHLWYRRCLRCPYEQAATGNGDLPTAMHKCDGILIVWPRIEDNSEWK